jgi:plasmid stabilization system protein ParE
MGLEIKWTEEAEETFDSIITYLHKKWTVREIQKFIKKVNETLYHISEFPNSFKQSKSKKVRKALLTKQNSLLYRVHPTRIELLSFWDNRFDPKKLKH